MFEVAKISSPARSEPVLQFRFVTLERFHLGLNRTFWGFVRRVKLGLVLFVVKIKPTRSAAVRASGRPEVNLVGIARIECMEAARSVCTWPKAAVIGIHPGWQLSGDKLPTPPKHQQRDRQPGGLQAK